MRRVFTFCMLSAISCSTSGMISKIVRPTIGPRIFVRYPASKAELIQQIAVLKSMQKNSVFENSALGAAATCTSIAQHLLLADTVHFPASIATGASLTTVLMLVEAPSLWLAHKKIDALKAEQKKHEEKSKKTKETKESKR